MDCGMMKYFSIVRINSFELFIDWVVEFKPLVCVNENICNQLDDCNTRDTEPSMTIRYDESIENPFSLRVV